MTTQFFPTPTHCDACNAAFERRPGIEMFDAPPCGRALGRWGCICRPCFDRSGVTLGVGRGQRYVMQPNGRFLLVEGGFDNTTSDNHDPLINSSESITCDFCDSVHVREICPRMDMFPPQFSCLECFVGQDDGPCWDDHPLPEKERA